MYVARNLPDGADQLWCRLPDQRSQTILPLPKNQIDWHPRILWKRADANRTACAQGAAISAGPNR
jgi:hypothetical protein